MDGDAKGPQGPQEIRLGERMLVVDRRARRLVVNERAWLFSWRCIATVSLDATSHLELSFDRSMLASNRHGGRVETYGIQLVLKDGRAIALARFIGREAREDHADGARAIMRMLERELGVPIGRKLDMDWDRQGRRFACPSCGHEAPPNSARCFYCGGAVGLAGATAAEAGETKVWEID